MHQFVLRRVSRVAASFAFLAFLSSVAQAGVYSFSDTFSFPLSPGADTLNLSLYDPSLHPGEALDHVEITIDGTVAADVTAENDSSIGGNMGVNLTGLLSASSTGLSATAGIVTSAGPVAVAATDGTAGSGPDFHDFGTLSDSGSDSDSTTSVGPYIGIGTFVLSVSGSGGFAVSGVTDSTLHINNFGASGTGTVTYYTVAVPEPSTIALALFGACGAALAVWRKRRSK